MAFAPRETKAAAYKTLIRPKLEYAAPVWMPYHQKEIERIEKFRGLLLVGLVDADAIKATLEKC